MKTRDLRNVSFLFAALLITLLMGCFPDLEITPITSIDITGDEMVGETLDAEPTPALATGTYQWTRADAAEGVYSDIAGATGSTYGLVAADAGKYLKVSITGTDAYSGTVTSEVTDQIANAGQPMPTGLVGVAPTSFGGSDGKITSTTAAMEYKLSSSSDYTAATAGEITGLVAGEYDVRFSAILGFNASDAASVDVPEYELIQLTVSAPTLTTSKTYDGDTAAVVTAGDLVGVVSGETVTVSAEANYDTKDVGTGMTITVVYTLGGADAANYVKPVDYQVATGEITAIQLTVTAPALTKSKEYDGNTSVMVTAGDLVGVVAEDNVSVSAIATYESATIGTGKTITVEYTLSGDDAANYMKPVDGSDATGAITLKQLTVEAPTLTKSKEYDGETTVEVTAGALSGIIGTEAVTVSAVATYDTKDVGTGKTITVVYTLGGADKANYSKPVDDTDDTGEITALPITAIGAISGTVRVGEELTAGTLTPSGATADYQWKICDTEGGTYADIDGATASTYTLVVADEGKFLKVVAIGTGNYAGTVTSSATAAVAEKVYVAGDTGPAGGLVFYDKGSVSEGWRYLEAAPTDIAVSGTYIYGYYRTDPNGSPVLIGATATAVGTGQANTTDLVNAMSSNAYIDAFSFQSTSTTASYAAKLCDILVIDTFEDWFLPSKEELNLMYTNLKSNGWGGFTTTGFYWSSSEVSSMGASARIFDSTGNQADNNRSSPGHVRAIRSF